VNESFEIEGVYGGKTDGDGVTYSSKCWGKVESHPLIIYHSGTSEKRRS
jgi:hypothetical protein